ncbi:sodium/proline symporter PutP [Neisseriaceae bacterium PsAf]|nr:sodium/proline symporter PutP [Neisseriaceae bacterium PsAf]MCV2503044.1 sodium/proline symporter PutP [Neisseriaceae bacterium]
MGHLDPTTITFIIYIVMMLSIGILAFFYTNNISDYILGGRSLGSFVTALSAGASDMSGWLLMGLPGAIYLSGLVDAWIAIGLVVGSYLNWLLISGRLRGFTEVFGNSLTLPEFFQYRFSSRFNVLKIISALIILVFFTVYCSSGMVAGARLFQNVFGLEYHTSLWIAALATISYTFIGGFLAVSWSDTIQGSMMFFALILVPVMAIIELGGWGRTQEIIYSAGIERGIDYTSLFGDHSWVTILSLLAWGLGYFGQPHILARFMAAKSVGSLKNARRIGIIWMATCLAGSVFIGYIGIGYFYHFPELAGVVQQDAEQVFIELSRKLFNPWVAGFLLSAILAAIMSTLSCQLLICSSAIAEDFYKGYVRKDAAELELVWVGRVMVIVVAVVAIFIAQKPNSGVLDLVSYAWAGFGSAFGPLIIFSLYWKKTNSFGALAGIVVGAMTVIIWKNYLDSNIYEIIPGFIFSSIAIVIVSLATKRFLHSSDQENFERAVTLFRQQSSKN